MTIKDKLFAGSPLGFGTAPLGNMIRAIPDAEAAATVHAAGDPGTRFFDTAPFYGAGPAELRLGEWLRNESRDSFVLSTVVGRIILDEIKDPAGRDHGEKGGVFAAGRPNEIQLDYSIREVARRHRVSLRAAALQFSLGHPGVAAVIPGASRPARLAEDHVALTESIPADFWRELQNEKPIGPGAPLPIKEAPCKNELPRPVTAYLVANSLSLAPVLRRQASFHP